MQPAVYVNFVDDLTATSMAGGQVKTFIATPKKLWGLGLNLAEFTAGLRIKLPDNNCGVTIKWQWSLDGHTWTTGATVITEKTAAGDYTGVHNTISEQMPFARLIVEVRDTGATSQKSAVLSVWGYYRYR